MAKCPKCGSDIIQRRSKKGHTFYGCSNWPNCDFMSWDEPSGENCPNCGGAITTLGIKVCPYCGSQVTEFNIKVWNFCAIKDSV